MACRESNVNQINGVSHLQNNANPTHLTLQRQLHRHYNKQSVSSYANNANVKIVTSNETAKR